MSRTEHLGQFRKMMRKTAAAGVILCLLAGIATQIASSQSEYGSRRPRRGTRGPTGPPEAEFHLGRMIYATRGGGGSHGYFNPWWAIDYPEAEEHFLPALRRLTNLEVADDSRHVEIMDDHVFDYPFLFIQQVGQGNWRPTPEEVKRLREYLTRGGFLLVDDFHGEYDWAIFVNAIQQVFPDRPIVDIPEEDPLMHVFYDLRDREQIPGLRHLRMGRGGQATAMMQGPPHWRGIYDDKGRLLVGINHNIDMGDAWEHADTYFFPEPMTAQAYRLGVNYVIYAMTH